MNLSRHVIQIEDPMYADVVALRERAYGAAGKRVPMPDADDAGARIVLLRDGVRAIGTIRVTLDPTPANCLYLRQASWARALPPIEESVAGSRMCVEPEARGRGLFEVLHEEMVRGARDARRRFVIGGAEPTLAEVYRTRGWRVTDVTYPSTLLPACENLFIYLDTST